MQSTSTLLYPTHSSPQFPDGTVEIVKPETTLATIQDVQAFITNELYQIAKRSGVGILQKGSLSPEMLRYFSTAPALPNGPNGADTHNHHHSVIAIPGDPNVETYAVPNIKDVAVGLHTIYKQEKNRVLLEHLTGSENYDRVCLFFTLLGELGHDFGNERLREKVLDSHSDLFFIEKDGNLIFSGDERLYELFRAHEESMTGKLVMIPNDESDLFVIFRLLDHGRSLRKKTERCPNNRARHLQINDPISAYGQLALRVRNTPAWDIPVNA